MKCPKFKMLDQSMLHANQLKEIFINQNYK